MSSTGTDQVLKKTESSEYPDTPTTYELNRKESLYRNRKSALLESVSALTAHDCAVAFSGGADSSLLLTLCCRAAHKNGTNVYAVTAQTELHPKADLAEAERTAKETGAIHKVLHIDEIAQCGIQNNPEDRCYRCKKFLFTRIRELAASFGAVQILDGTNADDLNEYRPGLRALKELGICSPIAENGMTKEEVRRLAAEYGVRAADRPSSPCLATRFPYNTPLSAEEIKRVEQAEKFLHSLKKADGSLFRNIRVRIHGDIVRIEVDRQDIQDAALRYTEITDGLHRLGYRGYITLDLEGFRSGSMDKYIKK